jgi:hypothetical protein
MRALVILSLCVLSVAHGAPIQENVPPDPPTRLLVFVGHFESLEELDGCTGKLKSKALPPEEKVDSICVPMDNVYRATYQVGETLLGVPDGPTISFRVADHYGYPRFAQYKHALLFVQQSEGGNYLEKYQGFQLSATADGSWAYCAALDGPPVPELEKLLAPVSFASGVTFGAQGELNSKSLLETFDPRYFSIRDGLVYCNKAIALHTLYKHVTEGVLKAQGIAPLAER